MRAILVLVAVGCSSKKEAPPAPPAPPAPAPAAKAAVADAAVHAPPAVGKQQLADYRKHMKAGWAQQKDKKWAEATKEFEAALVALPADPRALSELGWSAMNAGDFPTARKADYEAILVAVDPKVEASSYFNLGLVQERSGDVDGARRSYTESLALRPNKTVEDALAHLGAKPAETELVCDLAKPCPCLAQLVLGVPSDEDSAECSEAGRPPAGLDKFKVFHVHQAHWDTNGDYLLDPRGLVIGQIGGDNFHGRHIEDTKLDKAEVKTIAGHRVLWLQTTDSESTTLVDESDQASDDMGMDRAETTTVTVCVLGEKTTCPLTEVPIHMRVDHEPPHGKTTSSETTAEIAIGDDGTATVKLAKGAAGDPRFDGALGPHKLW